MNKKEPISINHAVIKKHGQYFVNLACCCGDSCWKCDGTGMILCSISEQHAKDLLNKDHKLFDYE